MRVRKTLHADGLILFQFAFHIPEYGGKKKSLFYCYVTTASEITTPYLKETDALLLGLLCMPWVLFLMHCGNL